MDNQIPAFLHGVEWKYENPPEQTEGDLPHVTHSGVLHLMGHDLRCFRLSNGKTVFEAGDFKNFVSKMFQ